MTAPIRGYQRLSFLDFGDKLASIIFFKGCNLDCPYCHNHELIEKSLMQTPNFIGYTIEDIMSMIEKDIDWLEGVVITGGEPCVSYKALIELLKKIKDNFKLSIKLDTNGSYPSVVEYCINKNLIDYVAMDIKHPNCTVNQRLSQYIIKNYKIDYEFRTTAYPPFINEKNMPEVVKQIKGAKRYYIQQFVPSYRAIGVKPYDISVLKKLKDIASPYVKLCEIRGI